jgi:hypothetical protein
LSRIIIIPDTQVKPGVDTAHIGWAAQAIVDYMPDYVVHIGDHWDMPSLSTHDQAGSIETVGRNVQADIDAGNAAFELLTAPMLKEINRRQTKHRKRWTPQCHFLFGNHEQRLTRAVSSEPKWDGLLSLDSMKTPGFQRHDFLRILTIEGIRFCHYFPNPLSGRPIGGTIPNRLNHIGGSFVQGHQQGFQYGCKQYPDKVAHGLVCGRFYSHHESYRATDVQNKEWNGIVVLNETRNDGDYDLMNLSYGYLQRKYG